ncbi:MAG TPA: hypothetical protein PLI90_06175 [Rhodocyclaceae bacterium]|nr:hypothetical protein [Rhodocyclaceae bacterium]
MFKNIQQIIKRWRIWLVAGVVIVILLNVMQPDESEKTNKAETFLRANEAIHQQLGTVSDVGLKKWWSFSASGSSPPRREYLFYVKGESKRALVTIRVSSTSTNDKALQYSLASVEFVE